MRSEFLTNLWRWKCGKEEKVTTIKPIRPEELYKTEWSAKFERLMRNRLVMGAYRYGRLGDEYKPQYDRIDSAIARLMKYAETGNQELLVDAANLCMCEYVEPAVKNVHFAAVDDGEHVKPLV